MLFRYYDNSVSSNIEDETASVESRVEIEAVKDLKNQQAQQQILIKSECEDFMVTVFFFICEIQILIFCICLRQD